MPTRRAILAAMFATAVPKPSWASVGSPAYLAAAKEPDESYAFFGLSAEGDDLFRVPLPARAHAGAGHPLRPEAVLFARRPGAYALVIDCLSGEIVRELTPPEGRQINGHGTYAEEGELLLTSEQIAETSEGRLGLWSVKEGYRRIGEIPTGGIGPHDVRLMPDGETLVVANGGIATDPSDRRKLNIPTMRPNLTFLTLDGLLDQAELEPELWKNSIRHLAINPQGKVAFAMQWQDDLDVPVPLIGIYDDGKTTLGHISEADTMTMKGYAGSIAFDRLGHSVAITSPRGGRMQIYDATGLYQRSIERNDVCGLAPMNNGFFASDGTGGLLAIAHSGVRPLKLCNRSWDNHIVAI